jgi:hypothetical protein
VSTPQGYDFGALYGMADHSVITPLEPGSYDAVVESAEFGRTKDGTKGAWTIKFRTTTGERAGFPLTMTMSINPTKTDGTPNDKGLGIMFRQLGAMGVPVPPDQPFWTMGWTEENVAQAIVGKPVLLRVINDAYDGTPRSKVGDIKVARPGAPTTVQQVQQAPVQQPAAMPPGYGGGYGQGQVTMQPYPPQQPYNGAYAQQQAPQGPTAPGPWQNAQQPAYPPQQPPQQVPGAPAWAQPPQPGQGGMGEFTSQGQSYQGYPGQQPPQQGQNPYQQVNTQQWQQAQSQPPQQDQAPPAQFQPPNGQPPQQAQPPQQQPQQPQQPQGAPELPPWAR